MTALLDRATLGIVLILICLCNLAVMTTLWRTRPSEPALGWWAIASSMSVVAFVAMAGARFAGWPFEWVLVLNNTLSLGAIGATLEGALNYRGHVSKIRRHILLAMLPAFTLIAFVNRDDATDRYLLHDALAAAGMIALAAVFLRSAPRGERAGYRLAAFFSAVMAVTFMTRWSIALQADPAENLYQMPQQNIFLLVCVLYSVGWIVSVSVMCFERSQAELVRIATQDALTGLSNRRRFEEEFQHLLARARRSGSGFGLALFDMNGFKGINDTHGHAAGDAVLVEVARRLQGAVRAGDLACRLGGDEFAVLLHIDTQAHALTLAGERLRSAIDGLHPVGRNALVIECSVGLAQFGVDGDDAQALQKVADHRMYQDKSANKGRLASQLSRQTHKPHPAGTVSV